MQFYKVVFNHYTFIASHVEHDDNWFEVFLGGPSKKCVMIHIYPEDHYCTLTDVHHDKQCNMYADLPNKSGTRDMIFAGMHLCKLLYPSLTHMSLQDESAIRCGGGVTLPLGDVYMLLYGKTWYQTYCDAQPMNNRDNIVRLANTLSQKPTYEWKTLWKDYLSLGFVASLEPIIRQQYEFAESWHAFFQSIRDENCKTWPHWVSLFMKVVSRGFSIQGTMWKIDMKKLKIESALQKIEEPPKPPARPLPARRMYFGGRKRTNMTW